jgi:hypothetical protein
VVCDVTNQQATKTQPDQTLITMHDISALQVEDDRQRALRDDVEWFDKITEVPAEHRFVLYGRPVVDIAFR